MVKISGLCTALIGEEEGEKNTFWKTNDLRKDKFFLPDSLARRVECGDFQLAPDTEASGPLMKLERVSSLYCILDFYLESS